MELPQKIETLIVKYLAGLPANTWPAYFNLALILPGEIDEDKLDQLIQVVCEDAEGMEDPPYSANFWFPVRIELRTPVTLQASTEVSNANPTQLTRHQAVADVLKQAIVITNLVASLNTTANAQGDDSKNFAALGFTDRQPIREQHDDYWVSGFVLRLYACENPAAQ